MLNRFPRPTPVNSLYPQAHPVFQGKQKERQAEPLSARTPTLFASHIQLYSIAVTRTAIRTSFPIHISPFGGLGAAPPKSQPLSAVIGTSVAHKVPACYTVRRTFWGYLKLPLVDNGNLHFSLQGAALLRHHFGAANCGYFPFFCQNRLIWHHPNISKSLRTLCSFAACPPLSISAGLFASATAALI